MNNIYNSGSRIHEGLIVLFFRCSTGMFASSGVARIRSYGGLLLKFCLTRKDDVQVYKLWNTTKIKMTYKPRKIEDYSFCNVEFSYITY